VSIVIDGIFYALGLAAGGAIVSWLTRPLFGLPLFILALFCLWFFRDPERAIPAGPNNAVSPADGKVVAIRPHGPGLTRISVFLNVFDVHVNRSPIAGRITSVKYHPGKFLVASREEATSQNEQNILTVEDARGTKVTFSQIAGLIARRIVCYKKPGDEVAAGDRIGLIKFGSRVDILLGPEWDIVVKEGERVSAGSTIPAQRK
jgi:phosphatidylserine decarboxylase